MIKEAPRNLLLIVIDQFRADLLSGPFAQFVPLPHLRRLAEQSLVFDNHHTTVVPCGPARASLLTGQYAMSHRSVYNGAPLPREMPNLASMLRTVGRELLLFGYTDTQPDPRNMHPNDPAHRSYTGPIPGITELTEMREEAWEWLSHLRARGYDVPDAGSADFDRLYRPAGGKLGGAALYRAEDSDTAYLTDRVLAQLDVRKSQPWSAMVTYIRPHPPFVAPAPFHNMIAPKDLPNPVAPDFDHPFFEAYHAEPSGAGMFWGFQGDHTNLSSEEIALCRATYLALAVEVDLHIGRILSWLDSSGQRDDTLIVLTADHGEMLGDLGLWGKQVPFRTASHIPLMMSHPDLPAHVLSRETRSIDITPTLLRSFGAEVPGSMQGRDLFDSDWRDAGVMVEIDLADPTGAGRFERHWQLPAQDCRAVAFEHEGWRLVHFASEHASMLFHVGQDPMCRKCLAAEHPEKVQKMTAQLLNTRLRAVRPS